MLQHPRRAPERPRLRESRTYVFSDEHNCDHAYVRLADHDVALRRAKAEGRIKSMWEAVHIANTYNCDHNHGKKATEAVDNVLLKLYDRIAELEADARAAQIEEGE